MAIEKAYIESEKGTKLKCLFNPSQLSLSKSNSWAAGPNKGKNAPDMQFGGGQPGSLSMELVLDTTGDGEPVTKHTDKLMKLMEVDPSLPGFDKASNTGRPPWVTFHWGGIHSFRSIIESLSITFTYFSSEGVPLRAKANLTLKQYEEKPKWGKQNPTSGTPTPHRVHRIQPGETLDRISASYYADATKWRLIAAANDIVNPLAIKAGTSLVIPQLEVIDRG